MKAARPDDCEREDDTFARFRNQRIEFIRHASELVSRDPSGSFL